MKFELIAELRNGARISLDSPEFVGSGLTSLPEAVDAARDAFDYTEAEHIDIYCDGNVGVSNGWCGYLDDCGWHKDADCTID